MSQSRPFDPIWNDSEGGETTGFGETASSGPGDGDDAPLPESVGRYQIESLLGSGGMGRVYKAFDPSLNRHVAIKVLREADPELCERFALEARSQARVEHENVLKVYEVGEENGRPFIAMQFIAGGTLGACSSAMRLEECLGVMRKVAEGVHAAHKVGLIHRDLKPGNIMVERTDDGEWKPYVTDFGLAREQFARGITATGIVVGTIEYMSPEQARGETAQLDRRSDVYSLGATLFELLAGRPPFKENSLIVMMRMVLDEDPPLLRRIDPRIPADLETIVATCLAKEPQRRYESARALAEDLRKYLEGEPIAARPVSRAYRILRKIRKHKIAVAVSTLAVLTALTFAFFGLRAQLQAGRRAALAQRYGQELKEVESTLRIAHLLPRHEIMRERELVRASLKKIEAELQGLPRAARGPGLYALGRGEMALQDYDSARRHLEEAWNMEGYGGPEVAYALGLTFAKLYQRELDAVERIANPDSRKARRSEIEQLFRDPARIYLGLMDGSSVESPEYAQALLALLDRRYADALARARIAANKCPWLYEASALEGDVHLSMGRDAAEKGDYDAADQAFQKAGEIYARAMMTGRSDEDLLLSDAERHVDMMGVNSNRGVSPEATLTEALRACDAALVINPSSSRAYTKKAGAYRRLGDYLLYHSDTDPRETYRQAIEAARAGISRNAGDLEAVTLIGDAFMRIGEYSAHRGEDPTANLNHAIQSYRTALGVDPSYVAAHHGTGYAYWLIGRWETDHGRDPTAPFGLAIESYKRATAANPRYIASHIGAGNVCVVLGEFELSRGKDAAETFVQAVTFYRKCLDVNPNLAMAWSNTGLAHWRIANCKLMQGQDPIPSFQESIACCQRAVQIDPRYEYGHLNLGLAYRAQGGYELSRGRDPSGSVARALTSFEAAERINQNDALLQTNISEVHNVQALYAMRSGRDPSHALEMSLARCREALRLNPESDSAHTGMGEAYITVAVYSLLHKRDPTNVIEEARSCVTKALRVNPASYYSYYQRGVVEVLAARWAMSRHQSPAAELQRAQEASQKAIGLNSSVPGLFTAAADAWHWKARWELSRKEPADEAVMMGLSAIDRALALTPADPEALATKGALLLAQAMAKGDVNIAGVAQSTIEKALELNPLLRLEYGSFLGEAKNLKAGRLAR